MWLIDIRSRALVQFEGRSTPSYAILSHRWEDDEVSFQDLNNGTAQRRKGFHKLDRFCTQVLKDAQEVDYVWMDTCCIDRSNNSELSEAINSMYRWYEQAKVCYAYLADISSSAQAEIEKSVWFLRGWTLQELLAPRVVYFFNRDWVNLGDKITLNEIISQTTGIATDALEYFNPNLSQYTVAQRMSWASARETTREEDMAYCLLGIFGVNMPLIYGEGPRAFLRLQEEILKVSEDLTIFAWETMSPATEASHTDNGHRFRTFAQSPRVFRLYDPAVRKLNYKQISKSQPSRVAISGSGLTITLFLIPYFSDLYIAPIGEAEWYNSDNTAPPRTVVAMFIHYHRVRREYRRVRHRGRALLLIKYQDLNLFAGAIRRITLDRVPYSLTMTLPDGMYYGFNILTVDREVLKLFRTSPLDDQKEVHVFKRDLSHGFLYMKEGDIGVAGLLRFTTRRSFPVFLHIGFDFDFNPFCLLSQASTTKRGVPPLDESWLSVNKVAFHRVPVASNAGILSLVNAMKAKGLNNFSWKNDRIELHIGFSHQHDVDFLLMDRKIRISMDLPPGNKATMTYRVTIEAVQRHKSPQFNKQELQDQIPSIDKDSEIWVGEPFHVNRRRFSLRNARRLRAPT